MKLFLYLVVIAASLIAFLLLMLTLVLFRFSRYQKNLSFMLDRKVAERTRELQLSEKPLKNKLGEQGAFVELISGRLHASTATVRGLWSLRVKPGEDLALKQEFEAVAGDLVQLLLIIDKNREGRPALTDSSTPILPTTGTDSTLNPLNLVSL